MAQEQSVIIVTHSAFIFQCPWFIKRQFVLAHPPHPPPLPPPPPPLSMISATLCRSVQIESGMDEDEATWLGDLCSSDYRLGCRGDRQTDGRGKAGLAVCPGCTPPSLSLPPAAWSYGCCTHTPCTVPDWLFLPSWHGHALHVDTPLSLPGSICCFLSLSFLHWVSVG